MWKPLPFAAVVALVAACSSSATDPASGAEFPATAYAHVACPTGACAIDVRTSPQPPRVGTLAVELRVTGRDGEPVDGLTLDVTPMMAAHGHGAGVHPTIEALGGGVYVARNVSCYMAGSWELRTQLRGSVNDDATIVLDVR